ncbi:MAG: hypothetical protein AB1894_13420 [Chloroflexota bacterium]
MLAIVQFASVFRYPRGMRFRFEPGTSLLDVILRDRRGKLIVRELEKSGFTLLGVLSESAMLIPAIKSLVFASTEHKSFVSIAAPTRKAVTCFFTPFQEGQVLLTADGYFKKINTKDCVVQVLPRASVQQLLEAHQARQQAFEEAGATAYSDYSQAARLQTCEMIYANPSIQRFMRWNLLTTFGLSIGIAVIFALVSVGVIIASTIDFRSFFPKLGWQTYSSAGGGFSVAMPVTPFEEVSGNTHTLSASDRDLTYVATYTYYPPNSVQAEAGYFLDEFQNQIIAQGGTPVLSKDITLDGSPGREFRLRVSDEAIFPVVEGRVYLVGDRVIRVYVRYLVYSGRSNKIKAYLDSLRLLDEAELEKLRSAPPTIASPAVMVSFVKIHDCKGKADKPYAAFKLVNNGSMTFADTIRFIQDEGRNIILYGQPQGTGYSGGGFHTSADECGVGPKRELRPGETAYLSVGLNVQGCTPSCNARATIQVCGKASVPSSCVTQIVTFSVP